MTQDKEAENARQQKTLGSLSRSDSREQENPLSRMSDTNSDGYDSDDQIIVGEKISSDASETNESSPEPDTRDENKRTFSTKEASNPTTGVLSAEEDTHQDIVDDILDSVIEIGKERKHAETQVDPQSQ